MKTIAEVESNIDKTAACWRWLRGHTADGRPEVWFGGRVWYVYRLLYTHNVGPIPEKMTLDHVVCQNGWCCNPHHCEPVLNGVNVSRALAVRYEGRTACPAGHPYEKYRRYHKSGNHAGWPYCVACGTKRAREWKAAKRAAQ